MNFTIHFVMIFLLGIIAINTVSGQQPPIELGELFSDGNQPIADGTHQGIRWHSGYVPTTGPSERAGHFTSIIWANTRFLLLSDEGLMLTDAPPESAYVPWVDVGSLLIYVHSQEVELFELLTISGLAQELGKRLLNHIGVQWDDGGEWNETSASSSDAAGNERPTSTYYTGYVAVSDD